MYTCYTLALTNNYAITLYLHQAISLRFFHEHFYYNRNGLENYANHYFYHVKQLHKLLNYYYSSCYACIFRNDDYKISSHVLRGQIINFVVIRWDTFSHTYTRIHTYIKHTVLKHFCQRRSFASSRATDFQLQRALSLTIRKMKGGFNCRGCHTKNRHYTFSS